jgi:SAM-dependent methyltransferase
VKRCVKCQATWDAPSWQCPDCGFAPTLADGVPTFAAESAYENDGFPPVAFQHLMQMEERHFWFAGRNDLIIWFMQRYFGGFTSLLEIGCGNGFVLSRIEREFPQAQLAGSDLYLAGLKRAATRLSRTRLLQMDARRIPYCEEFDVVGCFDALEHIEQDEQVLAEIRAVLRPGGRVLISVPQHAALWSVVDEYSCHVRRYSRTDLREKMERAGIVVERMTSFVCTLLPIMYLRRLFTGHQIKAFDPIAELTIPSAVNSLMAGVLRAERFLIRRGVNMPFGGSLFALGRKAD